VRHQQPGEAINVKAGEAAALADQKAGDVTLHAGKHRGREEREGCGVGVPCRLGSHLERGPANLRRFCGAQEGRSGAASGGDGGGGEGGADVEEAGEQSAGGAVRALGADDVRLDPVRGAQRDDVVRGVERAVARVTLRSALGRREMASR
jgi:hypothetical protein